MSTWTTPATFTAASVLTAAQLNTEVRDHLNFLKGFADLITSSSTADTGTATFLSITRAAATSGIIFGKVSGDSTTRFDIRADGQLEWGDGTAASDTNLYRTAANALKTDDHLFVGGSALVLNSAGYMELGEITAPGVGAANSARLYADDNGAGKTRLMVVFATGTAIQIAIQA